MSRLIHSLTMFLTIFVFVLPATGQISPEEHASHHPEENASKEGAGDESVAGDPLEAGGGGMGEG
ncbi:MAG: hypothetical protein JKX70_11600, partial [Phycisphaerales bacterium]|nr:hypothetical protein [Phycisphaerales bacterium]